VFVTGDSFAFLPLPIVFINKSISRNHELLGSKLINEIIAAFIILL
jgi:hypothetical protein